MQSENLLTLSCQSQTNWNQKFSKLCLTKLMLLSMAATISTSFAKILAHWIWYCHKGIYLISLKKLIQLNFSKRLKIYCKSYQNSGQKVTKTSEKRKFLTYCLNKVSTASFTWIKYKNFKRLPRQILKNSLLSKSWLSFLVRSLSSEMNFLGNFTLSLTHIPQSVLLFWDLTEAKL